MVSEPIQSTAFRRALDAASRILGNRSRLGRLLHTAAARLRSPTAALASIRAESLALIRMVAEIRAGRYRAVPRRALLAIVAGLIYLVNPLDLIPDLLPAVGLLDDATVLAWVIHQVRRDLDTYLLWEREWSGAIDVEPIEIDEAPHSIGLLPDGT